MGLGWRPPPPGIRPQRQVRPPRQTPQPRRCPPIGPHSGPPPAPPSLRPKGRVALHHLHQVGRSRPHPATLPRVGPSPATPPSAWKAHIPILPRQPSCPTSLPGRCQGTGRPPCAATGAGEGPGGAGKNGSAAASPPSPPPAHLSHLRPNYWQQRARVKEPEGAQAGEGLTWNWAPSGPRAGRRQRRSSGREAAGTCRWCRKHRRRQRSTGRDGRSPWRRTSSPRSPGRRGRGPRGEREQVEAGVTTRTHTPLPLHDPRLTFPKLPCSEASRGPSTLPRVPVTSRGHRRPPPRKPRSPKPKSCSRGSVPRASFLSRILVFPSLPGELLHIL